MSITKLLTLACVCLLSLGSCEKYENFYANKGDANKEPKSAGNAISAYVDKGGRWSLPNGYAQINKSGSLTIYGYTQSESLTISLTGSKTGTYPLNGRNSLIYQVSGYQYRDASGRVEILEITTQHVRGTFSCELRGFVNTEKKFFEEGTFSVLIN